jgi:hypothetical protein
VIALALATGIAPSVWADEGEQAIVTAMDMLEKQARQGKHDDDA